LGNIYDLFYQDDGQDRRSFCQNDLISLSEIIIHETWVYGCDPETKQQSYQWKSLVRLKQPANGTLLTGGCIMTMLLLIPPSLCSKT
jgi:hypothetical protein